jgi:hypothetical protein
MTSHRKPTSGFWITVALVAGVIYIASFWPVCWLAGTEKFEPYGLTARTYYPLVWLVADGPSPIAAVGQQILRWNGKAFFGFQRLASYHDLFKRRSNLDRSAN